MKKSITITLLLFCLFSCSKDPITTTSSTPEPLKNFYKIFQKGKTWRLVGQQAVYVKDTSKKYAAYEQFDKVTPYMTFVSFKENFKYQIETTNRCTLSDTSRNKLTFVIQGDSSQIAVNYQSFSCKIDNVGMHQIVGFNDSTLIMYYSQKLPITDSIATLQYWYINR